MKPFILLLCIASTAVCQTVADSQRQAAMKHPDLSRAGSPLHTRFMTLYNEAKQNNPALLAKPDWPITLADRAAAALSQQPQRATPPPPPPGPKLEGFLDIPWAANPEDAAKVIESRPGIKRIETTERIVIFEGGEFAGQQAALWALQFADNKFHTAKVVFKPRQSHLLEQYREMKQLLVEKYGKPGTEAFRFKYPYEKDYEGHEITAIRIGKASIASYWTFPNPGSKPNYISISVGEALDITIVYQNGELMKTVSETSNEQSKKDL